MRTTGHGGRAKPVPGLVSNIGRQTQRLIAGRNIGLLILYQIIYNKRHKEMEVLRLAIVGMIIYTAIELWYNNIKEEK